ncbi:Protein-export membrane protein SecD [Caenispirillum salinarum AK4]|uniref:Protein translocase subunit SecD n=1 Tax=Caenispirillum salinarum AK4 TaxID=1238182 RepID=K9H1F6_9PROT|nr:protein translocase subunit SecD [Caenispirillum salinarum]EKV31397.1 Protein-export membrane protein SecD [Caenispirillum salinarum AK4]
MLYFAKWKIGLILSVILAGLVFAFPNVLPSSATDDLPEWLTPVNLGLDLQGGSHLLLEVETDAVIEEQLTNLVETVRARFREARIRYRDLGVEGGSVTVRVPEAEDRDEGESILRDLEPEATTVDREEGRFIVSYTEEALTERRINAVTQSIEIVRRRVDETGTREASIQRQGEERIIVELPGIDDPERVKELIGRTAKLTFHMVDHDADIQEAMRGRVPPGSMLLDAQDETTTQGQPIPYVVQRRVNVSGDRLTDAQPSFQNGQPVVSFRFDAAGARQFGNVTTDNVGRQLAIVLDNKVISAPRINEPIIGGSGVITGQFSVQEAQDLALLLRAGALPAPLTVLEERTVGPGLGADSIEAGALASLLGLVLVVVFMVIAYGLFGVFANIALLANLTILLGALSGLGATLTLPGIAGIVLTVGMAVDANVLIYERIREEIRNGRTVQNAIETGYRSAMVTILDSNVTTLVAAVLLFAFGSGPVKGFAVTLGIGIVTSMFTAIMVNRLMVVTYIRRTRPKTLPI